MTNTTNNKKLQMITKWFFLGMFMYLLMFLFLNLLLPSTLNMYSMNMMFIFSLLLWQVFLKVEYKHIFYYSIFNMVLALLFYVIFKYMNWYSVDWNSYHLEAMMELLSWKSLFLEKFDSIWLNYYPKSIEMIFAWFVNSFTNYDFWSLFKPLLMVFTFMNIMNGFLSNKKVVKQVFWNNSMALVVILSLMVVLNPVVMYQFFTLYMDDVLYLLLLNFIYFLFKKDYLYAFLVFTMLSWWKFMYILYWMVVMLVFLLTKFSKKDLVKVKDIFSYSNVFMTIFWVFVWFHQYIMNMINKWNPFYLSVWEWKIDIVSSFLPGSFSNLNNLEKFVGAFSKYSMSGCYEEKCWSNMMLMNTNWIKEFFYSYSSLLVDPLANWFWNMFYMLLICTFMALALFTYKSMKTGKVNKKTNLFLLFLLWMFTVMNIIPLPWASYYPFVFLVTLLSMFMLWKNFKTLKYIIMFLYLINLFLVSYVSVKFHYQLAYNKYSEMTFLDKTLPMVEEMYYYPQYKSTYGYFKLMKTYKVKNLQILKDKSSILKKCEFDKQPKNQINYCENWIFIYPNYGSFLWEYMFLKYKK